MAAVSYKCPNCGGDLQFDPGTQKFKCEYCSSVFSREEVEAANPEKEGEYGSEETSQYKAETDAGSEASLYQCPSCGAEIVTDATTAATFCFYCHNPVILQGKLSGEYRPEKIIPFAVSKKEAVDEMLKNYAKQAPKLTGNSIGILNVQKRIKLLCGREYGLFYTDNEAGGVTAHILLPLKETK